jgi:hypothetical protein
MWELEAAMERPLRDAAAAAGDNGGHEPVTLLPVLVGLTIEDLKDAQNRLYRPGDWPTGEPQPPPEVLAEWAALLARVTTIVSVREDQARAHAPDGFG